MYDPLMHMPQPDKRQDPWLDTEEAMGQMYGRSVSSASPRPSMGLFIGKLLIRMGQKLVKDESALKHIGPDA